MLLLYVRDQLVQPYDDKMSLLLAFASLVSGNVANCPVFKAKLAPCTLGSSDDYSTTLRACYPVCGWG